ncbi:hypothetical protein D3C81_1918120 [compost metagenome]
MVIDQSVLTLTLVIGFKHATGKKLNTDTNICDIFLDSIRFCIVFKILDRIVIPVE